jgi:hypothetical protein
MSDNKIKYDGSDSEMTRMGLIDESGSLIVERRNEYKEYMQIVQQRKMVATDPAPDREKLEGYFKTRERIRAQRIAKCKMIFDKIFCRSK